MFLRKKKKKKKKKNRDAFCKFFRIKDKLIIIIRKERGAGTKKEHNRRTITKKIAKTKKIT